MGRCRTLPHVAAIAGLLALAGCSGPSNERQGAAVFAREVSQAGGLDSATLLAIPSAVARDVAGDVLVQVSATRLARTFTADAYSGRPGNYGGFAPGFDGAVFNRSRFLRRGNLLIPYAPIDSHYLPVALTSDASPEMIFYPALLDQGGPLTPVYLAAPPPLLATYGVAYPVSVGASYVSPLDLGRVPSAAVDRPFINLRTPNTTSVSTMGGGTTTSTTSSTGGTGVTSVTGTTSATGTSGGRTTTTTGPAMTTTTGPATSTITGPAMTTTTGPAATTTSTTGPATTTTSTTGRSVSSSVSTGPASVTTTSSTGHRVRHGLRLREIPGSGQREDR